MWIHFVVHNVIGCKYFKYIQPQIILISILLGIQQAKKVFFNKDTDPVHTNKDADPVHTNTLTYAAVTFREFRCKSDLSVLMVKYICTEREM
jgi:hypothetical protein